MSDLNVADPNDTARAADKLAAYEAWTLSAEYERQWRDDAAADDNYARALVRMWTERARSRARTRRGTARPRRSRTTRKATTSASSDGDPEPPFSAVQMLRSDSEALHPASDTSTGCGGELEVRGPAGGRLTAQRGEASRATCSAPISPSGGEASCATLVVAARLEAVARELPPDARGVRDVLTNIARKLRGCMERVEVERDGRIHRDRVHPRCGHALCPACQATKAKGLQSAITRQLRATSHAERRHVRLSVLDQGGIRASHALLSDAFTRLRRSVTWRAVVAGGAAFVDLLDLASDGAATTWNPHTHLLVELVPGQQLRRTDLDAWWTELLTTLDAHGSSYVGPVYSVPARRDRRFKLQRSPQAFYVTRRARGEQLRQLSDEQLIEVALALPGSRLVTWFGTWRGLPWRSRKRSP